ncbi:MAG: hypothetical protein JXA46_02385 [Dehalococcoidales bacterium]|nr:hypothetical protein [Dehalococcoidales bacterium]
MLITDFEIKELILGRHWGRINLEKAMIQALREGRTDVERVRQILLNDETEPVARNTGILEQGRVVMNPIITDFYTGLSFAGSVRSAFFDPTKEHF